MLFWLFPVSYWARPPTTFLTTIQQHQSCVSWRPCISASELQLSDHLTNRVGTIRYQSEHNFQHCGPELVSSYSHRRRIWGFFIIYCRSLSAFSSIEVYLTAISRTDLCTRHSTVQYSTVHRIQYNRFGKQRLLRMTLSLLKLPCASLTPVPVSYTHTRPATVPSATRRHVSCHVISGQPRPHLRSWSLLL